MEADTITLSSPPAGLILAPGASADREHRTLVALEQGLPGLAVRRLTLATTSVARGVDRIRAAAHELADELGVGLDRLAYGGRSFGGRCASVAVADGLPAAALVLLSYPLHPPGKPERLRVQHFGHIGVPTLFVSGTRDPFARPDELTEHAGSIPAPVRLEWVKGDHSPRDDGPVVAIVASFCAC